MRTTRKSEASLSPRVRESLLRVRLHALGEPTSATGSSETQKRILQLRLEKAESARRFGETLFFVYMLCCIFK